MTGTDESKATPTEPQPQTPSHSTQTLVYEGQERATVPRYLFITEDRRLFRIEQSRVTVGSAPECDLTLRDPTVSRLHCSIRRAANRLLVFDEGSKNGVFLDGARVRSAELAVGATLTLGRTTLRATRTAPSARGAGRKVTFRDMVTQDRGMVEIFHHLERLAGTGLSVFIHGESGTGKELAAEAIHSLSPRAAGAWIPLNCGALPPEILEAELFGYEKGAFTGAEKAKPGVFEAAHGGTLLLDEIAELPLDQQPVLLRVLDSGKVRRVGSNRLRSVSVRIVSASNKDLFRWVRTGRFREDLYYRLTEAEVALPPLRDRPGDVPLLIRHFLDRLPRTGSPAEPPPPIRARLLAHKWPGNVRELRNLVRRAAALGWPTASEGLTAQTSSVVRPKPGGSLPAPGGREATCPVVPLVRACSVAAETATGYIISCPKEKPPQPPSSPPKQAGEPTQPGPPTGGNGPAIDINLPPLNLQPPVEFHGCTLDEVETRMIREALDQTRGNQSQAARLLGMNRSTFRLRLKRHGLT